MTRNQKRRRAKLRKELLLVSLFVLPFLGLFLFVGYQSM